MHPAFALVFFVVGLMFVLHTFANAFRWTCGWDREDDLPKNRGTPGDVARHFNQAAWECPHSKCLAQNPGHARYCRMCGRSRATTQNG
jgi:hypothetical protein